MASFLVLVAKKVDMSFLSAWISSIPWGNKHLTPTTSKFFGLEIVVQRTDLVWRLSLTTSTSITVHVMAARMNVLYAYVFF
jgi:hypothetical protein